MWRIYLQAYVVCSSIVNQLFDLFGEHLLSLFAPQMSLHSIQQQQQNCLLWNNNTK